MGLLHSHYIIRAEVDNPFTKPKKVKKWLKKLVKKIGMKICKHGGPHVDYVNAPGNCGVAAVVMIETSHIALHVWDKLKYPIAQLDVYSCSEFSTKVVDEAMMAMDPQKMHTLLMDRATGIEFVEKVHDTQVTILRQRNLKG